MVADEPDSLRQVNIQSEIRQLRRADDRRREQQIEALTAAVNRQSAEIASLQHAVEMQAAQSEGLVERATKQAVAGVFAQIGVDVNNPAQLQTFRDDLRFSAYARESAKKGFYGLITAVGSTLVGAILYFLSHWGAKN